MSNKVNTQQISKNEYISHITVGQVEKERGIDLHAQKTMKLSTYYNKHGLSELGKLIEQAEAL